MIGNRKQRRAMASEHRAAGRATDALSRQLARLLACSETSDDAKLAALLSNMAAMIKVRTAPGIPITDITDMVCRQLRIAVHGSDAI